MEKYLITTAIGYSNGSPHIGHLYEAILTDFIATIYKMVGNDVKVLTGTDEHGKKIEDKAKELNKAPIELCNKYSSEFKNMCDYVGLCYDYFIRTT